MSDEHLVELNDGLDVRVVGHVALEDFRVGLEGHQKILDGKKQEMTHRDKRRRRIRRCAAQTPLDRYAAETRMNAQKSNGHRHVGLDVVPQIKACALRVRIEDGDAHHG